MKKVLLFGDPGIDDSIAIVYGLLNPKIDIVGIVTGYGNVGEEQTTANTAYLLQLAGRTDIPIIRGARMPFSGEVVTFYPEIHGPEGLGPIRPPENIEANVQSFSTIVDIIKRYNKELSIVDLGRSTSLATAFVIYGDELMNSVGGFYLMGGAFNYPGNVTAVAEANFYGDPIATDLVLEHGRNITILPLNVTNYSVIPPELVELVDKSSSNRLTKLIKPIMDFYIEAYMDLIPGMNGAPVHDLLTLFALVNPERFQFISRRVRIETSLTGQSRGRTIADFRVKPDKEPVETLDHIAIQFDYQAFINDYFSIMTKQM